MRCAPAVCLCPSAWRRACLWGKQTWQHHALGVAWKKNNNSSKDYTAVDIWTEMLNQHPWREGAAPDLSQHLLQGRVSGLWEPLPICLLSGFLAQFWCGDSAELRQPRAASVQTRSLAEWVPRVLPALNPARPPLLPLPGALQPPLTGDMAYTDWLTSRPMYLPCSDHSMARPGLGCHFPGTFTHFYRYSATCHP